MGSKILWEFSGEPVGLILGVVEVGTVCEWGRGPERVLPSRDYGWVGMDVGGGVLEGCTRYWSASNRWSKDTFT